MKPLTIPSFNRLVKARSAMRKVQQMSWTLAKFDEKFPIETTSDEDTDNVVATFYFVLSELEQIVKEIKTELKGYEKKAE